MRVYIVLGASFVICVSSFILFIVNIAVFLTLFLLLLLLLLLMFDVNAITITLLYLVIVTYSYFLLVLLLLPLVLFNYYYHHHYYHYYHHYYYYTEFTLNNFSIVSKHCHCQLYTSLCHFSTIVILSLGEPIYCSYRLGLSFFVAADFLLNVDDLNVVCFF